MRYVGYICEMHTISVSVTQVHTYIQTRFYKKKEEKQQFITLPRFRMYCH